MTSRQKSLIENFIRREVRKSLKEFGPLTSPQRDTYKPPKKVKPIGPKKTILILFDDDYKDMYDVRNLLTEFDHYIFGWLIETKHLTVGMEYQTKYPIDNLKIYLDEKNVNCKIA